MWIVSRKTSYEKRNFVCYGPFGTAPPFVIRARILLQELTRLKLGWDESTYKILQGMGQVAVGIASIDHVPGREVGVMPKLW